MKKRIVILFVLSIFYLSTYRTYSFHQLTIFSKVINADSLEMLPQKMDEDLLEFGYVKIDIANNLFMYQEEVYENYIDSFRLVEKDISAFNYNILMFISKENKIDTIAFGFCEYFEIEMKADKRKPQNRFSHDNYNTLYYNGRYYYMNWEFFNLFIVGLPYDHRVLLDKYCETNSSFGW